MKSTWMLLACAILVGFAGGAAGASDTSAVIGVFGLSQTTEQTYIAAWVPVSEGAVVTGVRWYQNDGQTTFPEILATAGTLDWPTAVTTATSLLQDVGGAGSAWNEAQFTRPITSDSGGLYVIFHLPPGATFERVGQGGGFGLGYLEGDGVRRGWISGDGEDWSPVRPNRRIAVEAIWETNKSAVEPLVLHFQTPGPQGVDEPIPQIAAGMTVFPNPFNASVEARFSLPIAGHANLDVFDLQGRRVIRLLSEDMNAGDHSVVWNGVDEAGQMVASGVYFARLQASGVELTQSLVLVK
jgi:hypothetical protein